MKSVLRTSAARVIAQLGLPRLLHRMVFPNQLAIVTYHAIVRSPLKVYDWCFLDESSFRRQIKYLKRHFEVIHLSEAAERMKHGAIYQPTVVITFDDGFQNNYDIAFPILHDAGLPATIFLVTGLVNTSDTFWFCRLNAALAKTNKSSVEWNGCRFDLSGSGRKAQAVVEIQTRLTALPQPLLLAQVREIILKLGDDPDRPIEAGSPYLALREQAIREMAASRLIEFGAHTETHAILSGLSAQEQCDEITRSVTTVSDLTGHPCRLFAYPNGRIQDYNAETIRILKALGVVASVTGIVGPNDSMTSVWELRRYGAGADTTMAYFQLKVHHFIAHVRRLNPTTSLAVQ